MKNLHKQLSTSKLIEHALKKNEGILTNHGALSVKTGKFTGRSPQDKYIVMDECTRSTVHWGSVNQPLEEEQFHSLYQKVKDHIQSKEMYSFKGFVGADPSYRMPIEVLSEYAWHSLFAKQLFIRPTEEELKHHQNEFTIFFTPSLKALPKEDGTHSETFIVISFKEKVVLIGGTEYAGEMKKSMFSIFNFLLPQRGVFPMHCGANSGKKGDVSLFFGLSGTGKTTLSSDHNRFLIGDDEHGWSDEGIFNLEGGCYAKVISLNRAKEPDIYGSIRYGSVLENVVVDELGYPNYDDNSLTENTRAAYPLDFIEKKVTKGIGKHPKTIFFLTADAFGVLPPISKLNPEQAFYYFINGYTSKLAGTERGITKPQATFSTCFGAPFLPLSPIVYANMLRKKIQEHNIDVYLVNTGWGSGGYGKSERISLSYTRSMITAAIHGELKKAMYQKDDVFGLSFPTTCTNVPSEHLNPLYGWNITDYKKQATSLKKQFDEQYKKMTTHK